jgi:ferredoxin
MMEQIKRLFLDLGVNQAEIKTEAFGTVTRDPRTNKGRSAAIAGTVTFLASDARRPVPEHATILDVADEAGVFIDNACRSGTCASCRVKLTSGRVSMAVQNALTERDKADGYILACQAKIHGDVMVDA